MHAYVAVEMRCLLCLAGHVAVGAREAAPQSHCASRQGTVRAPLLPLPTLQSDELAKALVCHERTL
eukprot:364299-Chlamydomonas_euryale.AAC.5